MSEEAKRATCGCRDREDIPHAINCPHRPATDEEVEVFRNWSKHMLEAPYNRTATSTALEKLALRIDAERALNAKLREGLARYQHGAAQRHIDDIATIENLRALNAEMLTALKRQVTFCDCASGYGCKPSLDLIAKIEWISKAEGKAQ